MMMLNWMKWNLLINLLTNSIEELVYVAKSHGRELRQYLFKSQEKDVKRLI
jgi:hypothetical protein